MQESFGKSKYEKTTEELAEAIKEKDKLDYPLGHGSEDDSKLKKTLRDIGNATLSMPFLKDSIKAQVEIALTKKRLEKIYEKNEDEAYKLNDEYNKLLAEAQESGDDTKLKEFAAKELGMNVDALISK